MQYFFKVGVIWAKRLESGCNLGGPSRSVGRDWDKHGIKYAISVLVRFSSSAFFVEHQPKSIRVVRKPLLDQLEK